jgi:hypothetical protein
MVIGAEVGDGRHLSILIRLVGVPVLLLFGNVVDVIGIIGLAIRVSHWSIVTAARMTFGR